MKSIREWHKKAGEIIFQPKEFFLKMPTAGGYKEPRDIYINMSEALSDRDSKLTNIVFRTDCESVLKIIKQPDGGWTEFTWNGEPLAN